MVAVRLTTQGKKRGSELRKQSSAVDYPHDPVEGTLGKDVIHYSLFIIHLLLFMAADLELEKLSFQERRIENTDSGFPRESLSPRSEPAATHRTLKQMKRKARVRCLVLSPITYCTLRM